MPPTPSCGVSCLWQRLCSTIRCHWQALPRPSLLTSWIDRSRFKPPHCLRGRLSFLTDDVRSTESCCAVVAQDAHSRPGVLDLLQHAFITAVLPTRQVPHPSPIAQLTPGDCSELVAGCRSLGDSRATAHCTLIDAIVCGLDLSGSPFVRHRQGGQAPAGECSGTRWHAGCWGGAASARGASPAIRPAAAERRRGQLLRCRGRPAPGEAALLSPACACQPGGFEQQQLTRASLPCDCDMVEAGVQEIGHQPVWYLQLPCGILSDLYGFLLTMNLPSIC